MPSYEHYARNDETGEYVGWDGAQWVPVHPREVPGTVANKAAARQPQMRAAERNLRKAADSPGFGDRLQSIGKGLWETTGGGAAKVGKQMNDYQRENPLKSLAFPFLPAAATLSEGMVEGVKARGADMGTALDQGNYLRAAGDAIAIGTAPVGGTAFADTADMILEDPDRALGQALGIGATFAAPAALKVGARASGPVGRSLQRAGAERGALAMNLRRLPDIEKLVDVDPNTGRPVGPIVDILQSPDGLPTSLTQRGLREKMQVRTEAAGAAVGETKAAIRPGQYIFDRATVDNVLLKSVDDEIRKRTNTVGGQPTTRPDGRPLGRTTTDTTAIDNLTAAKQDILTSLDPATGKLDLADLFGKIDTWDDVYESSRVQAGGKLDVTSRAFTDKMAADAIRRTLAEQIPDLGRVNREYSSLRTATDALEANLNVIDPWLGPRGKRFIAAYLPVATATGFANAPLGFALAIAGAGTETLGAILTSTPVRTWSANRLYQFGRFLEAGDLKAATQVAQAASAETQAASSMPKLPDLPDVPLDLEAPPSSRAIPAGDAPGSVMFDPRTGMTLDTPDNLTGWRSDVPPPSPKPNYGLDPERLPVSTGPTRFVAPPENILEWLDAQRGLTPEYGTVGRQLFDDAKFKRPPVGDGGGGVGGAAGRPTTPPPTAGTSGATPSGAGGGPASTPALPVARRMPELPPGRNPFDVNEIIEGEIIDTPLRSPSALKGTVVGAERALPAARKLPELPPAPLDMLPGGGIRVRGSLNFGEVNKPGIVSPRPEQTITPTIPGVAPRAPIRTPTPDPYAEVVDLFNKRNAFVADEAGRAIDAGNANVVLKEAAAARAAATPAAPATAKAADKTKTAPAPKRLPARPEDILEPPARGAITPKQAPKPTTTATPAKPVDYSSMDAAGLQTQLRNAERHRDSLRKMSAGSNAFRDAQRRVDEIKRTLESKTTKSTDAQPVEPEKPKRVSANRRGQRIEGVLARSFDTGRGRAMILRADDGSERFVLESEIQPS